MEASLAKLEDFMKAMKGNKAAKTSCGIGKGGSLENPGGVEPTRTATLHPGLTELAMDCQGFRS